MRRLASLLVVASLLLSCDSTVGGPFVITDPTGTGPLQLRLLHASPNAGTLQLLIGGQSQLGAIGYGSVTPYADLASATVELTLVSGVSLTPIIDTIVTLPDTAVITVVADGDSASIQIRFVLDGQPLADTTFIQLRLLQESPASGPLDVYVTDPLVAIDTVTPTNTGVGFKTLTPYLVLPSGSYQVRLTAAGTKNIVVDGGVFGLGNGAVRTMVVLDGDGGGLPAQFTTLRDAGT